MCSLVANTTVHVVKKKPHNFLRGKWESSNAQLQSRMNDVTAELKKRSDSFQLQCVEGVNNVLDYIEFSLENYTLPPSDSEGKVRTGARLATVTF